MEKVDMFRILLKNMMVIGLIIYHKVMELGNILMVMFMNVNVKKIKEMEKVHIFENMVKNMMIIRLMMNNMVIDLKSILE